MRLILLIIVMTATFTISASAAEHVLFSDDFGPASHGQRVRNTVVDPPPQGMGYTTDPLRLRPAKLDHR